MRPDPVKLLPVLYEAPTENKLWEMFLNGLTGQTRATVACLIAQDKSPGRPPIVEVQSGADPDGQRLYNTHYGAMDTFAAYSAKRGFNHPGFIVPAQAFVSDAELINTEFCNDFLLKQGLFHECLAVLGASGVMPTILTLLRGRNEPPFDEPELSVLRFLAPHIQKAIQLTERFRRLRMESDARQAALDQMGLGVVFLDGRGKVRGTNEAALRLLERQDGVSLSNGRLRAELPPENRSLRRAIWKSCRTGAGRAAYAGAGLLISRRPPARQLQVVIGPICASIAALPACPTAVVFIADESARIRPQYDLMKALYGLTPAESRVAYLLLDGKSIGDMMAILRVSRNTLKSQIRSIFDKTRVHRQSQLVRLLTLLPGQRVCSSSTRSVAD